MKRSIKTIKEERMKLLIFGALGCVKSPQIVTKMGSTSSLTCLGEDEAQARSNGWLELREEEGADM